MRDITMSKKIKVAVCKGRHEIPQATDGAIFGNTIKEMKHEFKKYNFINYWGRYDDMGDVGNNAEYY